MPEIIRDRTWLTFVDASGQSWDVMDQWERRFGEGGIERYPGSERAVVRIFRRYTPKYGSQDQTLLEERRYTFTEGESRWLIAEEFQRQLDASAVAG